MVDGVVEDQLLGAKVPPRPLCDEITVHQRLHELHGIVADVTVWANPADVITIDNLRIP